MAASGCCLPWGRSRPADIEAKPVSSSPRSTAIMAQGGGQLIVAGREHAAYCFEVLSCYFSGESPASPRFADHHCPLFVTWNKVQRPSSVAAGGYRLRGCIGTLEPRHIRAGLRDYALTSALRDHRFAPIGAKEVASLRCTVSLLCCFERAAQWDDWEIGVHGLIINFFDPDTRIARNATFLPEVADHEGWTRAQTIEALVRKSGYLGLPTPALLASLLVTRYQSTACSMAYEEYVAMCRPSLLAAPERELQSEARTVTVPA